MIFFNNNLPRKFSAIFIILIVLVTFLGTNFFSPPKQVQAQGTASLPMQIIQWLQQIVAWVKDYALQNLQKLYSQVTSQIQEWTKSDVLEQRSLKDSWNKTRAELLQELTDDIIKWAQGENGNTNFVSDWKGYLAEKTGQAGQDFIDKQIEQTQMCDTFAQSVKTDVKAINDSASSDSLKNDTQCVTSSGEMQSLANGDFTWGRWVAGLQSNYYLDLFQSLDKLAAEKQAAYQAETNKLIANQGFKGDANTPGVVQSYATQRASMMDFDYLLNSKDVNEYLSSVVDAFINRIKTEGLANMKTNNYQTQCDATNKNSDPAKNCKNQPKISEQQKDLNYVKQKYDYALDLLKILDVIKQNLEDEKSEQQKNFQVMQQIRDRDISCGHSTADIDAEIATLDTASSTVATKIGETNKALDSLPPLIVAMQEVNGSTQTGDNSLISQALEKFKAANNIVVTSLQALLSTQETDLQKLYDEASDYSQKVVEETAKYIEQRGHTQTPASMSDTLYGWLKKLNLSCAD